MDRSYGRMVRVVVASGLAVLLAVTAVRAEDDQDSVGEVDILGYCSATTPSPGVPATCGGWCFRGTCGWKTDPVTGVISCSC